MWESLSANLAVLLALLVGWTCASDVVARFSAAVQKSLFGLFMAVGTLGSMFMAQEFAPGVFFDLRIAMISISGFFGGLPAALVTAAVALSYRLYLGGAVFAAGSSIVIAALMGVLGYALRKGRPATLLQVVCLSLAVVGMTTGLVVLAFPHLMTVVDLRIPVFYSFSATLLLGAVLVLEARRRELTTMNGYYLSMVDALPDCLNIKDLQGRFLAANPATAKLMGVMTTKDLIGKTDFDFYPNDLAESFREDELTVLRDGKPRIVEQKGLLPNGGMRSLSTLKAPVIGKKGAVAAIVTLNRDVTEQKRTQTKLEETQAYLDLALESMSDGLAIYDANDVLLFCNSRYRSLFPRTAHLRQPGATFAEIVKAAIALGEEQVTEDGDAERYVSRKLRSLREGGEFLIELQDGKMYSSRTTILGNGCRLKIVTDATEQQRLHKSLSYQAFHDALTGLPNRAMFNQEFARQLEDARGKGTELTVMLLDVDRFKEVNDNFGHDAGDRLLIEIARRLEGVIRQGDDLVARFGGDEFAVLLPGAPGRSDPATLAERMLKTLGQPYNLGEATLLSGTSIGYTTYPEDGTDQEGLLRRADRALYLAKASGRRTYRRFRADDPAEAARA